MATERAQDGSQVPALPDPTLMAMLGTLRGSLNAVPEPSGRESITSEIIASFLSNYGPDELIRGLGGHGVAAVFDGRSPGPTIMVRADLDAVQVETDGETGARNSQHVCGHDAHMTMVAALAPLLATDRPQRGRVVLLFQPAEENGTGAFSVLQDPRFAAMRPDRAIGLHNLPGVPARKVVVRSGPMASASVGLECELRGIAAHAAEPDLARSPRVALGRLLTELPEVPDPEERGSMITVTHVSMGRPGFGVTPGRAALFATLRAYTSEALAELKKRAESRIREAATSEGLDCTFGWHDDFPATQNDPQMVDALARVCRSSDVELQMLERPLPWSDDFGHFAATTPSVYFGLGIGSEAVGLHQPGYAFPDEVLSTGVTVLRRLADHLAVEASANRSASAVSP